MIRKATILTLAALLAAGTATLAPKAAHAGADGRRNTTIALGAAAVYELLQHQTTNALILGVGTAYAEKQYENARSNERNQNDNRRYYRPGGYYDNNGQYQNGDGDYERRTNGGHDWDNRDSSHNGWSGHDNSGHDGWNRQDNDSHDNRGRNGQPYSDNGQNGDRHDNRSGDQRTQHRAWDGRALPPSQNNGWIGDTH